MRDGLNVGATGERRFVVEPAHAIDFAEGGMPAILCTPWLVWFLEHAARDAVVPFLGEGERYPSTEAHRRWFTRRILRGRD